MNSNRTFIPLLLVVGLVAACSSKPAMSADVRDNIRAALDRGGLTEVSVSQNREKGVVTLSGKVPTDADKTQAASLAQTIAPGQVVANEISVTPAGMESEAKDMSAALDEGIDSNMKALLIGKKFAEHVDYSVKAGVVTLTGDVSSQAQRDEVGKAAATVANVAQVVNELQVTKQKATSRKP